MNSEHAAWLFSAQFPIQIDVLCEQIPCLHGGSCFPEQTQGSGIHFPVKLGHKPETEPTPGPGRLSPGTK